MSQLRPPRLPNAVLRELEGLPWHWVRGSRHWRLIIDGKQVLICSSDFSRNDIRSTQNAVANIRRYRRSLSSGSRGPDRAGASQMASM